MSATQTDLCFVQSPKTPLQKSMDLLGKQLSLYSLSIIGETSVLRPLRLWVPVSPLCVSRGHHAGGVAAGEEDPGHVHHRRQVTANGSVFMDAFVVVNHLLCPSVWLLLPSQRVSPSW